MQPAGNYTVETIDRTLDNLSFIAYRRVSTSIMLPAVGAVARQRQVIFIDPLELEAAQKRDAQTRANGEPSDRRSAFVDKYIYCE